MSLVIEDMPPLMWHAELGKSLPDLWSGTFQRGVQLHDLRDAVAVWGHRYGQRGWLRQLEPGVTQDDGGQGAQDGGPARRHPVPVLGPAGLARWVRGRVPQIRPPWKPAGGDAGRWRRRTAPRWSRVTYEEMGLLPRGRQPNWYDPGRFWSGDELDLCAGFTLSDEIAVDIPTP